MTALGGKQSSAAPDRNDAVAPVSGHSAALVPVRGSSTQSSHLHGIFALPRRAVRNVRLSRCAPRSSKQKASPKLSLTYWRLIADKKRCVQYAGSVPRSLNLTVGAKPEHEFINTAEVYRVIGDLRHKFNRGCRHEDV
jgi:hypothetical protein